MTFFGNWERDQKILFYGKKDKGSWKRMKIEREKGGKGEENLYINQEFDS